MKWCLSILWLGFAATALADVYLHNPRGSNNRLNERSANRNNANRVFDSQNNNRGGYNVGDLTNQRATKEDQQYPMKFFQSGPYKLYGGTGEGQSIYTIEWTNQHGCGGNEDSDPHKLNCNLVLQYMCQKDDANLDKYTRFRDGLNTGTQNYQRPNKLDETRGDFMNRRNTRVQTDRVLQEPYEWYDKCYVRERNKGLFTADQKLRSNNGLGYSSAIYTRQNPNGNRRGYECPEERDYYPYWHPTHWTDIAVLAENASLCDYYQRESHNVRARHECVEWYENTMGCPTKNKASCTGDSNCEWWEDDNACRGPRKHYSRWNNKRECEMHNGYWLAFTKVMESKPSLTSESACAQANRTADVGGHTTWWGAIIEKQEMGCHVVPDAPDCREAPWSRVNHLGNGRDAVANNYTWVLPHFSEEEDKKCVFRLRYNISTDDYDPYKTDASMNNNPQMGVRSPVTQNPTITIGSESNIPLRLAINTAQFGRTFQDRSHSFRLLNRARHSGNFIGLTSSEINQRKMFNLNVRGKRGNIVQTFPSVEYDFFPNDLTVNQDDLVHVQWTGSNTHNNGNPAGDGQAGDAGEGTGGTDRHNIVQAENSLDNFPLPYERTTMWKGNAVYCFDNSAPKSIGEKDIAVMMASSGYYQCFEKDRCGSESVESKQKVNNLLNNAPASFPGCVMQFTPGTYHYFNSRNNNFTNRSQKGTLRISKRNTVRSAPASK
ncbi:protein DD3-3-like [Oscarella lobularis]|uniref:protein DD3-3-like n=1 Tax=Oscarella lobularis TaxID=121494 RepID=UPI0033140FA3